MERPRNAKLLACRRSDDKERIARTGAGGQGCTIKLILQKFKYITLCDSAVDTSLSLQRPDTTPIVPGWPAPGAWETLVRLWNRLRHLRNDLDAARNDLDAMVMPGTVWATLPALSHARMAEQEGHEAKRIGYENAVRKRQETAQIIGSQRDAFRASLADIRQAVRETGHLRGWDATYTDQKALDAVGEALMPVGRTLIADGNLNDARAFLEEHAPALGANRLRALQNAIKSEQRRRDAEAEANRNKENYEREAYAVS